MKGAPAQSGKLKEFISSLRTAYASPMVPASSDPVPLQPNCGLVGAGQRHAVLLSQTYEQAAYR